MEYNVERWVLERAPGSAKTRIGTAAAGPGLGAVVTTRGGKRPTSSPTTIPNQPSPDAGGVTGAEDSSNTKNATTNNGDGNCNKDDSKPSLRKELSAYIRTIKAPPHPEFAEGPNDGSSPGKQDQQVCLSGEERRESGVALAAKRVARRKRQEKADEEARKQVYDARYINPVSHVGWH